MFVLTLLVTGCDKNAAGPLRTVTHARAGAPTMLSERASDVQFGTIKSITPFGRGYKLRFDLGVILAGATGAQSCADNGQCPQAESHNQGFPDDISAADLHYILPYYLPPGADITLFNPAPVKCSARELYLLSRGQNPRHLIERAEIGRRLKYVFGWWIEIQGANYPPDSPLDSVVRVQQQWHP
jgi:hypothetical protein